MQLPLEDNYDELRRQIWLATDGAYKKALEDLARKRAHLTEQKPAPKKIPDFSREESATEVHKSPPAVLDLDALETASTPSFSGLFREMSDIYTSRVRFNGSNTSIYYLNSEGSSFSRTSSSLSFHRDRRHPGPRWDAAGRLRRRVRLFAGRPFPGGRRNWPAQINAMGERLKQLRQAPLVERFTGPVIFSGQAATELFNQGFVPYMLSTRRTLTDNPQYERFYPQKKENPFLDKIGVRVLPEFLSVRAEPLMDAL